MDINKLIEKLPIGKSRSLFLDKICKAAPEGVFVECGVYFGWSATVIINAAEGKRKIYLCDSYAGFPNMDGETKEVKKIAIASQANKFNEETAKAFIKKSGISLENVIFVKGFFKDSLPELAETIDKIAVLHFDGDFYTSAIDVFKALLPKMAKGGYVVIHDYPGFAGVKKAVEEMFDVSKIIIEGAGRVYFKVE